MRADLDALISRACELPGRAGLREVVAKELLHYDMLFALQQEGLLNGLVFQGGTLLRLCHGSKRFSEDLDFMGGPSFDAAQMSEMRACLESYIGGRYGLDVTLKAPRPDRLDDESGVSVSRWQLSISPTPARPDLPRQRIKFEVCNLAPRASELVEIGLNYDFLPDGYQGLMVAAEPLQEVMADKLISLPACTRYVRHRDIWDLAFLAGKDVEVDRELVRAKIADYGVADYGLKLEARIHDLQSIIDGAEFSAQMSRFLPADVLDATLRRDGFKQFLHKRVSGLLQEAMSATLGESPPSPQFDLG